MKYFSKKRQLDLTKNLKKNTNTNNKNNNDYSHIKIDLHNQKVVIFLENQKICNMILGNSYF
jgi:hypothetical protein